MEPAADSVCADSKRDSELIEPGQESRTGSPEPESWRPMEVSKRSLDHVAPPVPLFEMRRSAERSIHQSSG